jgi:hypothetical protein
MKLPLNSAPAKNVPQRRNCSRRNRSQSFEVCAGLIELPVPSLGIFFQCIRGQFPMQLAKDISGYLTALMLLRPSPDQCQMVSTTFIFCPVRVSHRSKQLFLSISSVRKSISSVRKVPFLWKNPGSRGGEFPQGQCKASGIPLCTYGSRNSHVLLSYCDPFVSFLVALETGLALCATLFSILPLTPEA